MTCMIVVIRLLPYRATFPQSVRSFSRAQNLSCELRAADKVPPQAKGFTWGPDTKLTGDRQITTEHQNGTPRGV